MKKIELEEAYEKLGIEKKVYDYCSHIESSLKDRFEKIDVVAEYNQQKVLKAMMDARIDSECKASDHMRDPCHCSCHVFKPPSG